MILNEVLMGFCLHAGLTDLYLGVDADLAAVGNAIGSGIPVAALLGKPAVMALFERGQVVRAGAYSGNPPACAAVLAILELLIQQDYCALLARGDALRARLASTFAVLGLTFARDDAVLAELEGAFTEIAQTWA